MSDEAILVRLQHDYAPAAADALTARTSERLSDSGHSPRVAASPRVREARGGAR
jgi:hypothetical protein